MFRRLGSHLRNQWAGFLSLFLVLTGGIAYAANTIGSADIIDGSILSADVKNGQVTKDDLADNAVRTGKVLDESLTGHDIQNSTIGGADVNETLLDPMTGLQIKDQSLSGFDIGDNSIGGEDVEESLTKSEILDESLTGHDIQDDTIGGADVNESLLDPLTHAQIEDESLTGHDIEDDTIGGADVNESLLDGVPYSPAYATHDPVDFDLPANGSFAQVLYTGDGSHGDAIHVRAPGILMATASLDLAGVHGSISYAGCQLRLNGSTPIGIEGKTVFVDEPGFVDNARQSMSLTGAIPVAPGDYFVNVVCRSLDWATQSEFDRATFDKGSLIAWTT